MSERDNDAVLEVDESSLSPPSDPDKLHTALVLVSLPPAYPTSVPPQLQLLSRYVGPYGVDPGLFGAVLRTYISRDGVEWVPGAICVFDGLESVRERCSQWLSERMSASLAGELEREDERAHEEHEGPQAQSRAISAPDDTPKITDIPPVELKGVEIVEAEPIVDRKSSFVGRACQITDPAQVRLALVWSPLQSFLYILTGMQLQVPVILAHLMSDRRISRAAHPIINAWRCRSGNVLHQGMITHLSKVYRGWL